MAFESSIITTPFTGKKPFSEVLLDQYNADEVWPLVDIKSGTTIKARNSSSRDGVLDGWDLQNGIGPVDGTMAPYSDYDTVGFEFFDTAYFNATGMSEIFDFNIGSFFVALQLYDDVAGWTDRDFGNYILYFSADNARKVVLWKAKYWGAEGYDYLQFDYRASPIATSSFQIQVNPSGWFTLGASWQSTSFGGVIKMFINGEEEGSHSVLGGDDTQPTTVIDHSEFLNFAGSLTWRGWAAYPAFKFGSVWSETDYKNMHNSMLTSGVN